MGADIRVAVGDVSAVLAFDGQNVTGTASPVNADDNMDADSYVRTIRYEFVARISDFGASRPQPRTVVLLDGVPCFIESVVDDGAALTIRLIRQEDLTQTGGII